MKLGFRKFARRTAVFLTLLFLAAWALPSFFSAEHYRQRLERGLERALHRSVVFGDIRFRLLPRPGFTIENAVVREDPSFGSEPFARVDRIECSLRWRSLWLSRFDLARLRLEHASLNLVRSSRGEWNYENLLRESVIASPADSAPSSATPAGVGLELEADDARLNFILGSDKKPFAINDLSARLTFDPVRHSLRFRLAGSPVRTNLSFPSPGRLELEGEWVPGKDLEGPLNATLGTRGAFLYDWIPLVSGWNAGIYGILDAEIRLTGSARDVHAEGRCRLSELHRWEQLPLSEAAAVSIYLRGEFDRNRGRALLESLEVSFVDSRLHANGAIEGIPNAPVFDLVVALERSRLEDLLVISRSLGARRTGFGLAGRVDGFLSVQGPWDQRRYGGFFTAREVRLSTPSGTFPVSEVAVRIQRGAARLAPARIALSPRVDLVAEGTLAGIGFDPSTRPFPGPPHYDLELSSRAAPVHDIVGFAAALGSRLAQNLDAEGVESSVFHIAGTAWPPTGPTLSGRAEIHAARLLLPGLTEPLNLPSAQVEVHDDLITVDHLVAVLGTSVFSGKLRHRGDRKRPWVFDLHANALSLEQGSLWFEALGRRKSLIERLSGLDSSASRRLAASSLFTALNARGRFSTLVLTYRALVFKDFRAAVEIADRLVLVTDATFQGAGGHGHGSAVVDLTNAPAALSADVTLADASLTSVAPWLPPALRRVSGSCALSGHFAARGITREEIGPSLEGQMTLGLKNVNLDGFDPLEAFARHAGWGSLLDPGRGEVTFRSAEATLHIRDRQVVLEPSSAETAGVQFNFAGTYGFAGDIALNVGADFRRLGRRLVNGGALGDPSALVGNLLLSGRSDRLEVTPGLQVSRAIQ